MQRPVIRKHSRNLSPGGCYGDEVSILRSGIGAPFKQPSRCSSCPSAVSSLVLACYVVFTHPDPICSMHFRYKKRKVWLNSFAGIACTDH